MDTKEELAYQKIEQMYKNPKSHSFVLHLMQAFLPVGLKAQKIIDPPQPTCRCCILGEEVMSANDQVQILMGMDFKSVIKGMVDESERQKTVDTIVAAKRNRETGYASGSSDKYLSQSALVALSSFMINEIARGNRELNGMTRSMMRRT